MSIEAMKLALEEAYLEGFRASAEGYNNECGCEPSKDREWLQGRDNYVRQAISEAEQAQPVAHALHCVCGAVWDIKADGTEVMACTPDCGSHQRQPLTEWQPIGTAPKTGRKVILFYVNRNNLTRTVMARWLTDEQAAETDGDGVGLEGGWYECIDNWGDYTEVAIHEGEPSHWMPLPAPPIEAAHGIRSNDAA